MRCNRVRERLQKYIDGMITGRDLFTLEEHLRECPKCRQELDSLKELDARLKQEVPKYWQSIEPAPDFITRLKRIELETPPTPTSSIGERLSALWGRRRMALATGLAVCLVIALAITIPWTMSSDDDEEEEIVSEDLSQDSLEREATEEMSTPMPTEGFSPTSEFMVSAAGAPKGDSGAISDEESAMPASTPAPPAETLESTLLYLAPGAQEYNAEQLELAKEIALEDAEIQKHLGDEGYQSIEVMTGGAICNGPIVVIEKKEADPQGAFLCACVNLDEHKVVDIMFFPARPPNVIPEPTSTPTPTPLPGSKLPK